MLPVPVSIFLAVMICGYAPFAIVSYTFPLLNSNQNILHAHSLQVHLFLKSQQLSFHRLTACHIPRALINFYSLFSTVLLHMRTFYSLWLGNVKGSPLPHPGTSPATEVHRTAPANQSATSTATELFTGSGQQAFCVRLL